MPPTLGRIAAIALAICATLAAPCGLLLIVLNAPQPQPQIRVDFAPKDQARAPHTVGATVIQWEWDETPNAY